jgi:L(+)-tartrate dehydratase alpha subunit
MAVDCHIEVGYCHRRHAHECAMFCLSSRRACARIADGGASSFRTDPMWFTDYTPRGRRIGRAATAAEESRSGIDRR